MAATTVSPSSIFDPVHHSSIFHLQVCVTAKYSQIYNAVAPGVDDGTLVPMYLNEIGVLSSSEEEPEYDTPASRSEKNSSELIKKSQLGVETYFGQRQKSNLLTKRFCDLDEVELFEFMVLSKSLRERVKYGFKDIKGKKIEAKAKLMRDELNRYKLDVLKQYTSQLPESQAVLSFREWSSRQQTEMLMKANKSMNISKLPNRMRLPAESPEVEGAYHPSVLFNSLGPADIHSDIIMIKSTLTDLITRMDRLERKADSMGLNQTEGDAVLMPRSVIQMMQQSQNSLASNDLLNMVHTLPMVNHSSRPLAASSTKPFQF
ncbi:hypothetical protein PROFUN_01530 [Planoprotostelium fungivorum]|uniref:Uncharacterized protein n=1 Tax=Planoprotostelium fungivorum TaxID=1890364 RepID=A0A2P6NTT2_9EUKA|nr:hypothetical protein PROFUN_01530 [Planoprotostelium fungivorum]